jgi:multiple sugar transport system substrate-binding protein
MAFLKDLYDDGCAFFFTEGFPNPEFAARRALFTMGSSSGLPFYASDVATVAEEEGREPDVWGITAIPHTTADPVQNIYGGDVMITRTTPNSSSPPGSSSSGTPRLRFRPVGLRSVATSRPVKARMRSSKGYVEENPQWGTALDMLQYSYYEPQLISYQSVRDAAEEAFNTIMNLPGRRGRRQYRPDRGYPRSAHRDALTSCRTS